MKNELGLLIDELEKEYNYLEGEMKACIRDHDFIGADKFQKVLWIVNKKLNACRNLKVPNYDKLTYLKRYLTRIQDIKQEDKPFLLEYNKRKIDKTKCEIAELENRNTESYYNTNEILNCIDALLANDIDKVEIILGQRPIKIHFTKKRKQLKLTISGTWFKNSTYSIDKENFKKLHVMGFAIENESATKLLDYNPSKHLNDILEFLAIIVFDIFGLFNETSGEIKIY